MHCMLYVCSFCFLLDGQLHNQCQALAMRTPLLRTLTNFTNFGRFICCFLLNRRDSSAYDLLSLYSVGRFRYDFDSWREFSYLDEEEKEKGERCV